MLFGITKSRFCFGTPSQAIEVLVFRKRDKLVKMLRSRFEETLAIAATELSFAGGDVGEGEDEAEESSAETDLSIGSGSVIGSLKLQGTCGGLRLLYILFIRFLMLFRWLPNFLRIPEKDETDDDEDTDAEPDETTTTGCSKSDEEAVLLLFWFWLLLLVERGWCWWRRFPISKIASKFILGK